MILLPLALSYKHMHIVYTHVIVCECVLLHVCLCVGVYACVFMCGELGF